jgi:uncharacterized protein (TIGR00251 family)
MDMNLQRLTIREHPDGLMFNIRVQPRASRDRVAGVYDGALKVTLTASPVDNAANKACTAFLADLLGVAKSAVTIVAGRTGRSKQVLVQCPDDRGHRSSVKNSTMALAKG